MYMNYIIVALLLIIGVLSWRCYYWINRAHKAERELERRNQYVGMLGA